MVSPNALRIGLRNKEDTPGISERTSIRIFDFSGLTSRRHERASENMRRKAAHVLRCLLYGEKRRSSVRAYGSSAVILRFGTCPTGIRVTSLSVFRSTTDTLFD